MLFSISSVKWPAHFYRCKTVKHKNQVAHGLRKTEGYVFLCINGIVVMQKNKTKLWSIRMFTVDDDPSTPYISNIHLTLLCLFNVAMRKHSSSAD